MQLNRFLTKVRHLNNILRGKCKYSYSQVGEDIIVDYLFRSINIKHPSYLEIGSNHPFVDNNTYLFYCKGSRGVCVEPDSELYDLIRKYRPHDRILNAGIGVGDDEMEFYMFPHPYTGWNTFSKEEAMIREKETGIKVKEIKKTKLLQINDVIKENFPKSPDFLSIDVEGLDLAILKSLDFEKYRPLVICVETISFSISNTELKMDDLISYVQNKGYFVYADTHVNTIFCRIDIFNREK